MEENEGSEIERERVMDGSVKNRERE